jgi:hypothetical protein
VWSELISAGKQLCHKKNWVSEAVREFAAVSYISNDLPPALVVVMALAEFRISE